jgi:hypothetical protein
MTDVVTTTTVSTVTVATPASATVNVTGADSTVILPPGPIAVVSPIANLGTSTSARISLCPAFGGFYDDSSQTLLSISSPHQIAIGQTAYAKNVNRTNSGDIVATVAGNYSFTYSAVFANSSSQILSLIHI